ncbi:aminotransferase class I/II-fold pyridoxal phosphate-dependent enzyme [Bradyrhizobium sp. 61]|uniref:aminotransferase class I/II-fold pyridoxal phosphate-dependent enzyme n=1 Tax=Bradyrhizobium sp. 61 TaxID=2782679 RepID=UPI001FF75999|nr:aminotransferase class I/II-fold pyridoxal phosphate-dependent enzyme [Bradyrhizobium sp. 61]MCK1281076.1 aminotransferase class I/II-fold pyridoxal phosphate-dependent enzyme [Bradyrhizobium sp. 61]
MQVTAARLSRVKASASEAASRKARELISAGVDLISLATGEPDFDTPDHVIEAAIAAMRGGQTRYTSSDGTVQLKRAIATKFVRDNNIEYAPNEILASSGAKNVVFLALMASLDAGDEVIVPAPHWVSYTDMTVLVGGTPVVVSCSHNNGYKLDAESLEKAITPRTKWLLLNSPNNPTGAICSKEELEALAEVVRRHPRLHVMTDEIYEHIIFDGLKFHSFAAIAPDLKSRTLTINGVSKAYAMTGWRTGFAGGPVELIESMRRVQSQSLGSSSSISQAAAAAALTGPQEFLLERSAAFQARRDRVISMLNWVPGLSCSRPQGAFYLFVGCADLLGRRTPDGKVLAADTDVAEFLVEYAKVMVVNGGAYGLSPHFRISIATSLERLEEACRRITSAISALR